ncbi:hypothetical protein AMTR_s00074p00151110 [Amborella trichopoda]|uniref:Uncharacterized protein n=1 Tax=Amborella trichopoda TaxID=13333 RepID=W1NM45_AMBTC|nr:hypothetical protein AMTR_s00074p00151110 [Amborella trichopoda]
MVGNPRLNPRIAFSAGRFEGENKEILVQHLLVGEQSLELLLELQKRIAGGWDFELLLNSPFVHQKKRGECLAVFKRDKWYQSLRRLHSVRPLIK